MVLIEPRILGRSLRSRQAAAPLPSSVPRHRRGEPELLGGPIAHGTSENRVRMLVSAAYFSVLHVLDLRSMP